LSCFWQDCDDDPTVAPGEGNEHNLRLLTDMLDKNPVSELDGGAMGW